MSQQNTSIGIAGFGRVDRIKRRFEAVKGYVLFSY